MTTWILIGVLATGILVVGIAAKIVLKKCRAEGWRARSGPEYAGTLPESGDQRLAEASLEERRKRVERFRIRPLAPSERFRFAQSWSRLQARFVDDPTSAVTKVDQLVGDVMSKRGYPVGDFEQRSVDISVNHPLVLENYRAAHEITLRHGGGQASTEDLRQAMIHYRALFEELIDESESELDGEEAAS